MKSKKLMLILSIAAAVSVILLASIYFFFHRSPESEHPPSSSSSPSPHPLDLFAQDIVVSPDAYKNSYVKLEGRVYFCKERLEHVFSDETGEVRLEYSSGVDPLIGDNIAVEGYVRWLGGKSLPYLEVVKQYRSHT